MYVCLPTDQLVSTILPAVLSSSSKWEAGAIPDEDGNAYTVGMSWAHQQAAGGGGVDDDTQMGGANQKQPLSSLKTVSCYSYGAGLAIVDCDTTKGRQG